MLGRLETQGSLDPEDWESELEKAQHTAQTLESQISKLVNWATLGDHPSWMLRPASAILASSMGANMAFGSGLTLKAAGFARREKLIAADTS